MYWNNPLIEAHWPSESDPIIKSLNNGTHCLFWNPVTKFDNVQTQQRLADLCKWANEWLETDGKIGRAHV